MSYVIFKFAFETAEEADEITGYLNPLRLSVLNNILIVRFFHNPEVSELIESIISKSNGVAVSEISAAEINSVGGY